jgi:hypothetical protein
MKIILTVFVLAVIGLSSSMFSNAMAAAETTTTSSSSSQQPSSGDKSVKNNDRATKGDNRPNDHPACGGVACSVNNDHP